MRYIYLKKDGKYLHIVQYEHEDYQDYSDISAMYTQHYVLKDEQDGAKINLATARNFKDH